MKKEVASKLSCILHMPWYYILVFLFIILQAVILYGLGEGIYVSMHDNLDLHVADYHILSDTHTFFSQNTVLPLLGGIDRNYFASELSLYSLLYLFLPTATAYITGYLLKTIIAVFSVTLLAKDILKEKYIKFEGLIVLSGFAFGILPLYPTFSFPFVSLPLVIYLLRKAYYKPKIWVYALLFIYPVLSYFTFFGFFILSYLLITCVFLWIRKKRVPLSLLCALITLSLGYVVMEYRLFGIMLFDSVPTIRETMVVSSLGAADILKTIGEVFAKGIFHADAVHTWFVLPICIIYFIYLNIKYIKNKQPKNIFFDRFNQMLGLLLFNCIIYGLYYLEPFRTAVESLLPPLKGFQFNRTVFFNPFLWYFAFFIIIKRLYENNKYKASYALILTAIFVILSTGSKYNDLYSTCFNYAYRLIRQTPSNSLTYGEFYSEALFEEIKLDIGYRGEKSVAYGMHPAVPQYNGIYTLDGCLSYYPQEYKEKFRRIIAPALAKVESFRLYYDEWGARAYLFAGVDENVYEPVRSLQISDTNLYIDADALRSMGGKYIFSRLEITNADSLGLTLKNVYAKESSPYTIYLYDTGI